MCILRHSEILISVFLESIEFIGRQNNQNLKRFGNHNVHKGLKNIPIIITVKFTLK